MKKAVLSTLTTILFLLPACGFSNTMLANVFRADYEMQPSHCTPQEIGSCAKVGGHLDGNCHCH